MVKNQKRIEQIAGMALIGAIVVGCGLVLRPFVSAILWAAILCFATWPLHELFLKWLGGRRNLTAALMTAVLSLVLIIPFVIVGMTFTDTIHSGLQWLDSKTEAGVPPPPAWLERVPLIGARITESWSSYVTDAGSTIEQWKPWLKAAGLWILSHSLDLIQSFLHLVLSVLIAFFFYRDGEGLVVRLREGFQQISGDTAQRLVDVVKTTVQSAVYGVIGTALAQGIVAGVGFSVARVPVPMFLAMLTFFLSFIPFASLIVWIGVPIWLFAVGRTGWGIFMIAYGVLGHSLVESLIKPYIISRGSKLSFIVMFIGVLGGVATFGFIGIFLGPTLLAVGFSLAQEIIGQQHRSPAVKPLQKLENAEPSEATDTERQVESTPSTEGQSPTAD